MVFCKITQQFKLTTRKIPLHKRDPRYLESSMILTFLDFLPVFAVRTASGRVVAFNQIFAGPIRAGRCFREVRWKVENANS